MESDHTIISEGRLRPSRRRRADAPFGADELVVSRSPMFFVWLFGAFLLMGLTMPAGFLILHFTRANRHPLDVASAAARNRGPATPAPPPLPFISLWVPPKPCLRAESFFEPTAALYEVFQKTAPLSGTAQRLQSDREVFCYYNRSRLTVLDNQAYRPFLIPVQFCSHVIYGPIAIDHNTLKLTTFTYDGMLLEDFKYLRTSGIKLLVSVGGPGQEGTFSLLANRTGALSRLAASLVSWLKEHDFNGIDLHWADLGGPCGRPDDLDSLGRLVRHLQRSFVVNDAAFSISIRLSVKGNQKVLETLGNDVDYFFLPRTSCESSDLGVLIKMLNGSASKRGTLCLTVSPRGVAFLENDLDIVESFVPYYVSCKLRGTESFRETCQAKLVVEGNRSLWHVYESPDTIVDKVREVYKSPANACFVMDDLDMDDFVGSCGTRHALLRALAIRG